MNDTINRDETCNGKWKQYRHTPAGKIAAGIWVVIVGAVLLARQLGVELPFWLFTWPALIIAIGIYISARHLFCNPGGYILIIVGGVFLLDTVSPNVNLSTYVWPVLIIAVGLLMIFKSNKRKRYTKEEENAAIRAWEERVANHENYPNDVIDTVAIFGGVKKNMLTKNFKGGEITCVFGGAEINLMQADFEGRVELEVNCILGGTKLIIPAHWDVQPEMLAVLGGIEDKRQQHHAVSAEKTLILKGTSILGGIEIKSY
ncbi:MAG: hypothetical protein MUE96_10725 [Bacteroidia bacterium]|jgi:predicted membrane protein|nr:hypothetical protein [Bacteroidia bacterium]